MTMTKSNISPNGPHITYFSDSVIFKPLHDHTRNKLQFQVPTITVTVKGTIMKENRGSFCYLLPNS